MEEREKTVLEFFSGKIEAKLDKTRKTLAENVGFSIDEGETLALIGETGSGKTIIACSIMKLLPSNVVTEGMRVNFCGEDLLKFKSIRKKLGREIVYIPQSGAECLNPSKKIKRQIFDSLKKIGVARSVLRTAAEEKLRAVGFGNPEEIMEKYPFELSGGMAQKVVAAFSACSEAKLVIADEPTNGIDEGAKYDIMKLLGDLFPKAGKLLITHDISIAEKSDKVIVLCKGNVMETGETKKVLQNPWHPYTKALINALPYNGMCEMPKLRQQNGECPFYARCVEAKAECLCEIVYRETDGVKRRCVL